MGGVFAHVDGAQQQAVGVGVAFDFFDEADGAVVPAADGDDVADFEAGHCEALGEVFGGHVEVHQFFEPGEGDFHQNWPRKRRSLE